MMAGDHDRELGSGDAAAVEREARAWIVRLTSGTATHADAEALTAWRTRPEHDAAFIAASKLWRQAGIALPKQVAPALVREAPRDIARRRILRGAGLGIASASIAASGAALLANWPELSADFRTGTGEVRTIDLPGGVRIELDAETALDSGTAEPGTFVLHAGAVAVTVPANARPISLTVGPAHVATRPGMATEFVVRCRPAEGLTGWTGGTDAELSCLSGSVEVVAEPGAPPTVLAAGQGVGTKRGARDIHSIDTATTAAWRRGLLVFRDTPLSQVVNDLNRYRPGRIVLGSSAASIRRVTGIFHLSRPEEALTNIRTALALSEFRLGDRLVILR
ncbi:FecR family protein [Methylobacterium sp. CM6247]